MSPTGRNMVCDNITNRTASKSIISDESRPVPAGDADSVYIVALAAVNATQYFAIAAPLNQQAVRDTKCGAMWINQAGVKQNSGTEPDCW